MQWLSAPGDCCSDTWNAVCTAKHTCVQHDKYQVPTLDRQERCQTQPDVLSFSTMAQSMVKLYKAHTCTPACQPLLNTSTSPCALGSPCARLQRLCQLPILVHLPQNVCAADELARDIHLHHNPTFLPHHSAGVPRTCATASLARAPPWLFSRTTCKDKKQWPHNNKTARPAYHLIFCSAACNNRSTYPSHATIRKPL